MSRYEEYDRPVLKNSNSEPDRGPIMQEVEQIEKNLAMLGEAISSHRRKVSPILGMSDVAASNIKSDDNHQSMLLTALQGIRSRITELREELDSITSSVEL